MVVKHTMGKKKKEAMKKVIMLFPSPLSLIYLPTREWCARETFTMKFIIVTLFSTAQGSDSIIRDCAGKLGEIVIESEG